MAAARPYWFLLLSAGLLLAQKPLAAAKATKLLPLAALPTCAPAWQGTQFLRADQGGRVFALRNETLEVFRLDEKGCPEGPQKLVAVGELPKHIREAAMDAYGDRWLLLTEKGLLYFVEGQEKPLPALDDLPWSLGFVRETPLLGVLPQPVAHRSGHIPWIVAAGKDRWDPLVDLSGVFPGDPLERGKHNEVIEATAATLASGKDGRFWVAHRYRYRLEHYSRGGRKLGEVIPAERRPEVAREAPIDIPLPAEEGTAKPTANPKETLVVHPFSGEVALLDFVVSREGSIYLLVRGAAGSLALDRYTPAADLLERRDLAGPKGDLRLLLAAGRDGLYLADYDARGGRWRIPWEELDNSAGWTQISLETSTQPTGTP